MKRRFISLILSVTGGLGLAVFLGLNLLGAAPVLGSAALAAPAQGSAALTVPPPKVAVYLKNYLAEYDLATTEFLAAQFDETASPASGLISYTLVTTLTQEALAGSVALVIDQSSDMALTASEAALIHDFVNQGGRIGLFTFPRHYWDQESPNPAAYQGVADIFGNATIGDPDAGELASGDTAVVVSGDAPEESFSSPYDMTGKTVANHDHVPFLPITSRRAAPILVSSALGGRPVAVANNHGILVTNPIGDLVQGGDANDSYHQFVANAIVWLAKGTPLAIQEYQIYLPMVAK